MALQSSGAISINNINVELGKAGTTTSSLGQSDFRTLAGVASGAISMSNFYGKSNWTLVTGTYASNTFTTNRGGFTPGPVYTSPVFTAVRPKTINMNIRMTQYDWDAWITWTLEVYYVSSGWITVGSGGNSQAAGTTWVFNTNVACTREEKATQYRFTANTRANNDSQTIKFTEWYT